MVDNATISPSIMMSIIDRIEKALWEKFETRKYQNVRRYISRWHQEFYDGRGNYDGANFNIISKKIVMRLTLRQLWIL